ncbi:glucosyltransferase domain-containing protein [Clostridium akagii]|uniref:glucosyltransferase domain-containing protein n=1 Tax=Clostridium akagii TaxID=91623 RepID=UPI00047D2474|nr:glucosyltransferase domain-containing protein [Clostridium akagii]
MDFLVISENISEQIRNFKEFIVEYKIPIICSLIFSLICFGFMLTNHSLTIDEETWINSSDPSNIRLWLMQGRFGVFLIDKVISPTGNYIPFLWDFLSVLIWNFSGVCFLFCISMFYTKFNKFSSFVFCSYFSSLPLVVGEILSYSMFNLQQSLGMLLMSISVLFIYTYFKFRHEKYIIISSILLFVSISIYQAFVVVYIVMIIAYVLIFGLIHNYNKQILINIIKAIFAFIFGVLSYYLINKIITKFIAPDPGNYLTGYIGWNRGKSNIHVMLTTLHYVEKILFGDSAVYGGKVILVVTCLFFIYSIFSFINTKKIINKSINCVLAILLLISPFMLSIVLGTSGITGRTYIALPLAGAIELLLVNNQTIKIRIINPIVIMASVLILFFNSMYMNRLFYDSYMVYQFDTNVGNEIIHDIGIDGYAYNSVPIVFIGMHDVDRKIISNTSGSTGGSFFSWDDGNNTRIINFLRSEGYGVIMPSTSQIKYAYDNSKNLINWPSRYSIKELNGCIVVKLSTPSSTWMSVNGVKSTH